MKTLNPNQMFKQLVISLWILGSVNCLPVSTNIIFSREVRRTRSLIHSDSKYNAVESRSVMSNINSLFPELHSTNPENLKILSQARSIQKPKGYEAILRKAIEMDKHPQAFDEQDHRGDQGGLKGRGYLVNADKKWKYSMFVMIDDELTPEERDWTVAGIYTLKAAMKCFDFKIIPVGHLSSDVDHIHIKINSSDVGASCGTVLGRKGGKQVINIGRTCKNRFGVTMHETMHALGFLHEHTRKDRDQHVKAHWNLIPKNKKAQFKIHKHQNMIDQYDFDSVMHYSISKYLTAVDGEVPTGVTVGQRNHLSKLDVERLHHAYPCSAKPKP